MPHHKALHRHQITRFGDTIGQQFSMAFSMNHGPFCGARLSLDSYTIVAEILP
jgi:hypothetical protein